MGSQLFFYCTVSNLFKKKQMTYHQIFVIPTKIKRGKQYHIVIFVLEVKATQNTFLKNQESQL